MTRSLVIIGLLLTLAPEAWAQRKLQAARIHYQAGAAYYQRGKYTDAIREFLQSYELSRKPDILYNLAQCHDKLGQRDKVVEYLKRYLAGKPKADDREQVEAWLANLERSLAQERALAEQRAAERRAATERLAAARAAAERAAAERAAAEPAATEPAAAAAPAAATQRGAATPGAPPSAHPGRTLRITGYATLALSAAALVLGSVGAANAGRRANDLETGLASRDDVFTPKLQRDYTSGRKDASLALGGFVAGGALAIGGALLLYFGYRARRGERTVVVVPTDRGAALAGRF
jgi:tetratricopeptide (TPR) repeat protein